jgi:hypothetical protein
MEHDIFELDYEACKKIETAGLKAFQEDLPKVFEGEGAIEAINGKEEQKTIGDFYMIRPGWGVKRRMELKTDNTEWRLVRNTNIFLETWSNFDVNPGWMVTSNADCLIYQFLKVRRYYIINFIKLKKYFETHKDTWVEKEQRRVKQQNIEKGLLWPVIDAERQKDFVRVVTTLTTDQEREIAINDIHKRRGDFKKDKETI